MSVRTWRFKLRSNYWVVRSVPDYPGRFIAVNKKTGEIAQKNDGAHILPNQWAQQLARQKNQEDNER